MKHSAMIGYVSLVFLFLSERILQACAACMGNIPPNQIAAYRISTIFLTAMPFLLIFLTVGTLFLVYKRRRISDE